MALNATSRQWRNHFIRLLAAGIFCVLALLAVVQWNLAIERRSSLLHADPLLALSDPSTVAYATKIAKPLYAKHCAACHGKQFEGNQYRGVPNLARHTWLYGSDPVDVERTILYGIRSGHPKARGVVEMQGLVRTGVITADDDKDVVEYLQSLAGQPHDSAAAERGRDVFRGKGNCFDCHAWDAGGVTAYGAPALTGPTWLYGGDRKTLYQTIYDGRRGLCPAWIDRLDPVEIRALALYLVTASPQLSSPASGQTASLKKAGRL